MIGHAPNQTPGDSPSGIDIVLSDPLSLTLDDEPRTVAPAVPQFEYVLPDVTQLPPGWTASEETAFGLNLPPDNGYRATYLLTSPAGESYSVDVMAGLSMKPDGGTAVDVNGHNGLLDTNNVWWEQEPGVGVTFERRSATASAAAEGDLIDAARSVAFVTVSELPIADIEADAAPSLTGADFAGMLNGVHYTVSTSPGPLRGIRVVVGDKDGGGIEDDRLSQPTDEPAGAGSVNIVGVAGYGVIAFGYSEAATAALRANLANGSTIHVPVLRNPGETYFALPVPLGVDVTTLDFLDDTGATLRTAIMPSLPAYFGHCCANAPWTTDLQSASTPAPPTT